MIEYLLFIFGFALLVKGADWLVDGASELAKRLGVSTLVIGLTVVAFGTSAPEFFVNVLAAIQGSSNIALGNIIGSNILNILLGLGIVALIQALKVRHTITWREMPFALLSVIVLLVLANKPYIFKNSDFIMHRVDGIVMLLFFAVFLYYLYLSTKMRHCNEHPSSKTLSLPKAILLIVGGIIGLYFGGDFVVDGAVIIAKNLGLSEFLISVTIIAFGTSLPELVTAITGILKNDPDLSIGTIVGTNIFNILFILGVTSVITPLYVPEFLNLDLFFLLLATMLLLAAMFVGEKHTLERWQGGVFIALYLVYVYILIMRG